MALQPQRIETPYGQLVASWTERGLYSCQFQGAGSSTASHALSLRTPEKGLATQLENSIAAIMRQETPDWDLALNDWQGVPEFQRKILEACFAIPSGHTKTYGELAAEANFPGAARAAGTTMARNRWPILIPCHRVVGAGGKLTGYSGRGGLETKRRLLQAEGALTKQPTLFPC